MATASNKKPVAAAKGKVSAAPAAKAKAKVIPIGAKKPSPKVAPPGQIKKPGVKGFPPKRTGAAAARPARKPLPTWQAPADFKPFFLEVLMKTEKDGLLGSGIRGTRYVGRYDPQAPDKKKFDLAGYDQKTLQGVLSRFAAVTFATNAIKRLPANTVYQVILRINRKSADGSLSVLCKGIAVVKKNGKGRMAPEDLDKKDANYRKFRKAMRVLPAAFKECLMPPKRVRGAKVVEDDAE